MKYIISEEIFKKYPSFYRGVVIGKNLKNSDHNENVLAMLRQVESEIRKDPALDDIYNYPYIANWREAHIAFGSNPKKYRASIDALLRRVKNGNRIPFINTLVALFNYTSLKYRIPCGGDDLDKISGNPCLKFSDGTEKYTPFNSQNEIEHPVKGEVIYADDEKVMCRKWNWRQGDQTKITLETKNVLINVDGLAPVPRSTIIEATETLANIIKEQCSGEVNCKYLTLENPVIEINF